MDNKQCRKLNTCYKVEAVLDQDWPFEDMYSRAIREMCGECKEDNELDNLTKHEICFKVGDFGAGKRQSGESSAQ